MLTEETKDCLSQELADLVERIAARISSLGLSAPAVFFLELHKPLRGSAALATEAFNPLLSAILGREKTGLWQKLLESGDNIELLIRRIEEHAKSGRN